VLILLKTNKILLISFILIYIFASSTTVFAANTDKTDKEKEKLLIKKIELKAKKLKEKLNRAPSDYATKGTPVSVAIGTNKTFTTPNYTDWDETEEGIGAYAETGFSVSEKWADAGASSTAVSEAAAYSYIGNSISVTGSGARRAKVTFAGSYSASAVVVAPANTAGANCQVCIEVLDLTTGKVQVEYAIYDKTITKSSTSSSSSFNTYIIPTLTAGHSYAFRMGAGAITIAEVAASSVEAALCNGSIAGWQPAKGGKGITYSSTKLEWYAS
jgi:hypothetical protein